MTVISLRPPFTKQYVLAEVEKEMRRLRPSLVRDAFRDGFTDESFRQFMARAFPSAPDRFKDSQAAPLEMKWAEFRSTVERVLETLPE